MGIYISLTTVPKRLAEVNSVLQNINSLLNQKTDKEYKVIFNIPYTYKGDGTPYIIPDELTKLAQENPKLILNRIETDRGPIEKVIGGLNIITDPEDIIIALDDDHSYEEDMVDYILKKMPKYPNSAIGFRGDNPMDKREFIHEGVKKFVLMSTHVYFPVKHDMYATIPGHWHSVTYKRKWIEDDILTDEFLGISKADDIIMAFYLRAKKIHFVMLAYDKETSFIPVNNLVLGIGTPSSHWPIKKQLSMPDGTGFTFYRRQCKDDPQNAGVRDDFHKKYNHFGPEHVHIDDTNT